MFLRKLTWALPALLALSMVATPALAEEANKAPAFELTDSTGTTHSLADFAGKWVVLEWVNYDCPFVVKQYHESHKRMQGLQSTYTAKGVVWLSICSSAEGKQGHMTPAQAVKRVADLGAAPTAVLLDADGAVGRRYGAKTTPDMRVINPKGAIVYSGAIDSVRSKDPADVAEATNYVATALDALLAGNTPDIIQTRPYGCSIKYGEPAVAKAPAFTLPASDGTSHCLTDFAGKWVVLEWMNYDCPFIKKHYDPSHRNMQRLQAKFAAKGVVWLSICSSAPGKQGYMTPEQAEARKASEQAVPTALLLDPEGTVGHLYGAKTTPDMRIIDPQGRVVYAGAIDSMRSKSPADVAGATNYIEQALDAVLAGQPAPVSATRPYG